MTLQLLFIFQMDPCSPYTVFFLEIAHVFRFEFSGGQEAMFHM